MANELTALPEEMRALFKHAYLFLPWFCRNHPKLGLKPGNYAEALRYLDALKKDRPHFFGNSPEMTPLNQRLDEFYDSLRTSRNANHEPSAALFAEIWRLAWKQRRAFALRGPETRLFKHFHLIYGRQKAEALPQLQCMARLIGPEAVALARMIENPDGWTAAEAVARANQTVLTLQKQVFGDLDPTPELAQQMSKRRPATYKKYQKAQRDRKEMARLRITEMYDEQKWHPFVASEILQEFLRREGLSDFLPAEYRGRVGVQPTGYPLTFYTYAGLELDAPALYDVEMNPLYGTREPDKDYKIHPISDGTYYCETSAMIGETRTKHYTLEYKRRARRLKYEQVRLLHEHIEEIRCRLQRHVQSEHRDTWVRALICLVIDRYYARIGNHASSKGEKRTYGMVTLKTAKHVRVNREEIILSYRGKHEQEQRHALPVYRTLEGRREHAIDGIIADRLMQLIDERREYLFTREDGKPYTPQMVNEYFTTDGPDAALNLPEGGAASPCTVHNIRNYQATRIFREFAADFAEKHPSPSYEEVLIAYQGQNQTKARPGVTGILDHIARKLGNTPAICRKSYVDPREQLLFFQRWGYRPPDCIIRDLFVAEDRDTYGIRRVLRQQRCKVPNAAD